MPKEETKSEVDKILTGVAPQRITDPKEATVQIMDRIFKAETLEDMFAVMNTSGADELIGRPLKIKAFQWFKSAFEDGPGAYAVAEVTMLDTNEERTATFGGANVVAMIARMADLGKLDTPVRMVKAEKATARGFYPLWLQAA